MTKNKWEKKEFKILWRDESGDSGWKTVKGIVYGGLFAIQKGTKTITHIPTGRLLIELDWLSHAELKEFVERLVRIEVSEIDFSRLTTVTLEAFGRQNLIDILKRELSFVGNGFHPDIIQ